MEPGTCKHCQHWTPGPQVGAGFCERITHESFGADLLPAPAGLTVDVGPYSDLSAAESYLRLETRADFGCVLFTVDESAVTLEDRLASLERSRDVEREVRAGRDW